MTKFKIGDRVRISESGKKEYRDSWDNPHDLTGTIKRFKDFLLPVSVVWENGHGNTYDYEDLELVTETETQPSVTEKTQMQYAYMITANTITVFLDGKVVVVNSNDTRFEGLKEHLKGTHDYNYISSMLDKPKAIARMTEGLVSVQGDQVFYAGEAVADQLAIKLVDLLDNGFDARPWAKFMDNLMQNPSYRSREQLYTFLEKHGAPITPDGHFIAFKNVRQDFKDIHSGTFDNSPGQLVVMPRAKVDDDPNRTCSAGLHACASPYLDHFYRAGSRTVAVKINPRDVVSIPTDYDFAKMRVSQYEVLFEVDRQQVKEIESQLVYGTVDPLDDYADIVAGGDYGYDDSYDSYDSYDDGYC